MFVIGWAGNGDFTLTDQAGQGCDDRTGAGCGQDCYAFRNVPETARKTD